MARNELNRSLRIDTVVASQPELGPSVPDGGYGWIILIASLILQVLIPSIITSYGIFMLYTRIELSSITDEPRLWDIALLPAPIVFVAFRTLSDPWSKTIVTTSTWPRLWLAMRESIHTIIYMLAGSLTGFGSSLALTQCETLIAQYFRLKLTTVTNLLTCGYALGYILVPIVLGFVLLHKGILRTLLIYQAILMQCALVVLVFKKPEYLKATRRRYELLQNASEDDEMIFAKDEPDLEQQNINLPSTNEVTSNTNSLADSQTRSTLLQDSFARGNVHRSSGRSGSELDVPDPLYNDTQANTLYTFDNNITSAANDDDIFPAPRTEHIVATHWLEELGFLKKLSFYKTLFLLVSEKYSLLVFWLLFPTYLYTDMTHLKVQQTTFLVGAMGLGSLFIALFAPFLPVATGNRQTVASLFCLLSSSGYFILSDAGTEGWLLCGALLITISITALHVLYPAIIKQILGLDADKAHTLLYTLTGISLLFLLVQDASYRNCFRVMALLQLISSALLFWNFLYKHFKTLCTR
ncbi:hermes [Carabus blaptoides fortunei]